MMKNVKSIYIHIPFCKKICTYCDFCKFFYEEKWVDNYLEALKREIEGAVPLEEIETIYIGGGTPSVLNTKQLQKLFDILKIIKTNSLQEFTVEMNPEDIEEEKLILFQKNGVNRISIGHQSKHPNRIQELGRTSFLTKEQILLVKKYFTNINVDFMYGFQNQNKQEFLEDLEYLISLDVPHISTYSLILESHTKLFIEGYQRLEEDLDAWMYETIQKKLESAGLMQYEISNFSKSGYESRHNLCYWNNQNYYGFGLGASGYIQNIRYTNTRNFKKYLKGERRGEKELLTKEDEMIYEMILGLRKIEGVSETIFLEKYGCKIEQTFDIIELMNQNMLKRKRNHLYIPKEYLYRENQILVHFLEVKREKREV